MTVTPAETARPTEAQGRWSRWQISPGAALVIVLVSFLLLSASVLALTPPWEANDEPDHVQNVETVAAGHMYRITTDANLESIQAPLYYFVLAAYQKALREPVRQPDGVLGPIGDNQQHGNYNHAVPQDGADQRLVDLLRLPSLLFGALTILFTFLAARRITVERWTPVVAAALVAGVPKFVFVSSVVNNDNLSNALGGAGLAGALALVALPAPSARVRGFVAAGLGLLAGALVLTKITGGLLAPGLFVAVLIATRSRRGALRDGAIFVVCALLICGWWFVYNQVRYGDPLAAHAAYVHQKNVLAAVFNIPGPIKQLFVEVPAKIWSSFWYDSGWNQFGWRWFWYIPFWALALVGIAGLVWRSRRPRSWGRRPLVICVLLALGALISIWTVGAQANTEEARLSFMGLPAMALLVALGYERLRLPVACRFLLPVIGLIGTVVAIRYNVIIPYS